MKHNVEQDYVSRCHLNLSDTLWLICTVFKSSILQPQTKNIYQCINFILITTIHNKVYYAIGALL